MSLSIWVTLDGNANVDVPVLGNVWDVTVVCTGFYYMYSYYWFLLLIVLGL